MAWHELSLESVALRGNALGDPAERPLYVWAPADQNRRLPTVYALHAMTGQARAWFNVRPFTPNVPEQIDALELDAIVVLVDAWTALGGSQWIDSPAIGRYGTYLCEEVVAFVDARFETLPEAPHRGLLGHSSGGFGAMVWTMLRPDLFGGFATHAGDSLFEVAYRPQFAAAAQALRNLYDGSFQRFWDDLRSGRPLFANRTDPLLQDVYAMAAAYSPRPDGGIDLPFRLDTGELVPEVWERWLEWDPVHLAPRHANALRAARAIWIDAGQDDEYHLDLGATAFANAVRAAGARADTVHFELHPGGHRGANWRLPLSLAFLAERLGP